MSPSSPYCGPAAASPTRCQPASESRDHTQGLLKAPAGGAGGWRETGRWHVGHIYPHPFQKQLAFPSVGGVFVNQPWSCLNAQHLNIGNWHKALWETEVTRQLCWQGRVGDSWLVTLLLGKWLSLQVTTGLHLNHVRWQCLSHCKM